MDGQLEFYDTADMTLMNAVEHSSTLDLEWDPTGRYLVSTVSVWNQKVRYYVWLFFFLDSVFLYSEPNSSN